MILPESKLPGSRQSVLFCFLALLMLQTAVMLYFCADKQEYHIDEIYSYILSNSYDCDRLSASKEIKNRWINGRESLHDFVSVQSDERFAYARTYYNNTRDAHPPFYYFLLHTVCSLFPDQFSKWFGLSINLMCFILTQFLLFLISRRLFNGLIWQLLPVTMYGFSPIAVDIVLYIRMYSLLALFTLLLFFIHLNMSEGKLWFPYLWCFAVTFFGMFTQYFFAVSAFYLALISCVVLWRKKKVRELLCYSASMVSGVLLVLLIYPAAFRQATGSSTNNVGHEVSSNFLNFAMLPERLSEYREQFDQRLVRNWKWRAFYMAVVCAVILLSVICRDRSGAGRKKMSWKKTLDSARNAFRSKKGAYISVTAAVAALTIVTVAHLSGSFSYLRYLYHLMPVVFFLFAAICYCFSTLFPVNRQVLSAGLMVFALIVGANTVIKENCEYLFEARRYEVERAVGFLDHKPLILLDKQTNHVLTGNYTLLSSAELLYISDTDQIDLDELTRDVDASDGVAVLVLNTTEWSEGYDGDKSLQTIVDSSTVFHNFEKYGEELYSTLYWVH